MKTNIYFYKTNAYNAVVFDQENGHYFMTEGNSKGYLDNVIDLYADDAKDMLIDYFSKNIADGYMDITNLCNSECAFAGMFNPNEKGVETVFIAAYDDVDTTELVEGII